MQPIENKVEMALPFTRFTCGRKKGNTSGRTKSRGVVLVIARMTQS
jgi:hypothetical protein